MRAVAIIPARLSSSRFPGKPLADIAGLSMIERVYRQALQCELLSDVFVATADKAIYDHVTGFGGEAILTAEFDNGTHRVAAAYEQAALSADVVVNIQGDQPLIHPDVISTLIETFRDPAVLIATLIRPSSDPAGFSNPNLVKVSFTPEGRATGFYRRSKSSFQDLFHYHIGTYAFRPETLRSLASLPPSHDEQKERLEQLRWMHHGFPIHVIESPYDVDAVDVPGDIDVILRKLGL